jgi:hypothetical protein
MAVSHRNAASPSLTSPMLGEEILSADQNQGSEEPSAL